MDEDGSSYHGDKNIFLKDDVSNEEAIFLNNINKNLPKNIDWRKGALDYISNFVIKDGPHAKWFHYSIPFGDNYQASFRLVYNFYNVLQLLNLPPKSKFIDVGCGSGWLAQFLSKLNHCSLGIDISEEMIEMAKERIKSDIYTPFQNTPLAVDFLVHDIEEKPLPLSDLYDVAIFESSLHHFYNPISAIRNISKNLKEDGFIVILEGQAPPEGSKGYNDLYDVMNKFHTLERPYTREQLKKLLNFCDFNYFNFYYPINGFFEEGIDNGQLIGDLSLQQAGNNNVIASRSAASMEKITETRYRNVIDKKGGIGALNFIALRRLKGIFSH